MSTQNCLVWYGACIPMSREEMQRLDRPNSPYFTPLFEAGLDVRWEKLRTIDGDGHHLLVGVAVAELGEALDPLAPIPDAQLLPLMTETQERLRRAGVKQTPQLHVFWLTDDEDAGPRWLKRVACECLAIQPGHTRTQLLEVFEPAGGISGIIRNEYFWHRESPYLHLTVHFQPEDWDYTELAPTPDDVIVEVSPPYLAYPMYD
jgi:hypothetical protein